MSSDANWSTSCSSESRSGSARKKPRRPRRPAASSRPGRARSIQSLTDCRASHRLTSESHRESAALYGANLRREQLRDTLERIDLAARLSAAVLRGAIEAPAAGENADGREAHLLGETHQVLLVGLDQVGAGLGVLPLLEAAHRVHAAAHAIARFDDGDLGSGALEVARGGQPRQSRSSHQHSHTRHSARITDG